MRSVKPFVMLVLFLFIMTHAVAVSGAFPAVRTVHNPGPSITVTSPKAGESFKIGSPIAVSWSYSGNVGQSVKVFLHKNSTPTADKLMFSFALDGKGLGAYSTPVPKEALPGNDYVIVVVSDQNPNIKGGSGVFSLAKGSTSVNNTVAPIAVVPARGVVLPLIVVNQPAGDKVLHSGSSCLITWTNKSSDKSFAVNISLLKGNDVQKLIAAGVPVSQGSFNWAAPSDIEHSDQYRIQIASATDENKYHGWSDFFTVVGPPTISSFSPTAAGTGDVVNIVGKYFTETNFWQGFDVQIGNAEAYGVKVVSDTLTQAKVSSHAVDGPVVVKTTNGTVQVAGFTKLFGPGDALQGGTVVYTDATRRHGLIVANKDCACATGCDSGHGCCETCTWAQANASCQQPQNGSSGWRLPSQSELVSVFTAYENGSLGPGYFNLHGGYACDLWSSTSGPTSDTAHALLNPYTDNVLPKTQTASARAVKTF